MLGRKKIEHHVLSTKLSSPTLILADNRAEVGRRGAGDDPIQARGGLGGLWQLMRERAERTRPQIRVSHGRAWAASVGKATLPAQTQSIEDLEIVPAHRSSQAYGKKLQIRLCSPRTLASFAPHHLTQKTSGQAGHHRLVIPCRFGKCHSRFSARMASSLLYQFSATPTTKWLCTNLERPCWTQAASMAGDGDQRPCVLNC